MKQYNKIILISIIIFCAIIFVSTVVGDQVVHHSDYNASLKDKWDWAQKQSAQKQYRKGFWIGYSIEKLMNENSHIGTFNDSRDNGRSIGEVIYGKKFEPQKSSLSDAEVIRRAAREAIEEIEYKESWKKVMKEIAVLFRYDKISQLKDVKISTLSGEVDLKDLSLIWLGKSESEESVYFLYDQYKSCQEHRLKGEYIAACGIHPTSITVVNTLENIIKNEKDNELRGDAAFWMGQQSHKKALTILTDLAYKDASISVQEKAVFAISQIDLEEAVPTLIEIVHKADNQGVREKAVFWLGQSKDERALDALLEIVRQDPSSSVRGKAVFSISQIDMKKASEALVDLAQHAKHTNVREKAIFWLGQRNDTEVLEILRSIADSDPSMDIREKAVFSISQMESEKATQTLINLAYKAKNNSVRRKAIFWLGQKASQKASQALEKIVYNDKDYEIQKDAVFAISQFSDDQSVPYLVKISKSHPSIDMRKKAIFWLGQKDDKRAVDALVEILEGK